MLRVTYPSALLLMLASFASAAEFADLKGKITFKGDAPALKPIVSKGDPVKDAEICAANPVPDESLVVGEDGGIANVFIYLRKAPADIHPNLKAVPNKPAEFTQVGCKFIPHALIVRAGQGVAVSSGDKCAHNTHTFPIKNKAVNFLLPALPPKPIVVPTPQAELLPIQVKCDIHAWMSSYWMIVDHPYAAVTNANGEFEIKGLPVGSHSFRVWHEKAGYLERSFKVTVEKGMKPEILEFSAKDFD